MHGLTFDLTIIKGELPNVITIVVVFASSLKLSFDTGPSQG